MRTRFLIARPRGLLGVAAVGGMTSVAAPASLVTSTTIATGSLDPINLNIKNGDWKTAIRTKGGKSTLTRRRSHDRVAPGGSSGWHSHPYPAFMTSRPER